MMFKLHNNYKKVNSKLSFKYMTLIIGNLVLDIPLSVPINLLQLPEQKRKVVELEDKYWLIGSEVLLED